MTVQHSTAQHNVDNEKIFVLVPVYKAEEYLERCIDSILSQTYTNWEMVLIDDGSPDDSGIICDHYAMEYENITVIHQENTGVSVARNNAISYSKTHGNINLDWISFVDSDDYIHPKYLEYLHKAAIEANVEISCCAFERTTTNIFDKIEKMEYETITPETFLCKNPPNANIGCAKLYRLALFEDVQYPKGKVFEDDFTTHKIIFKRDNIAVISNKLYYWFLNQCSISASAWNPTRIDKLDALEAQLKYFSAKGYINAYKSVVETMFLNSVLQVRDIRAMSPKYDYLLTDMKKRQFRAFKLFVEYYGGKRAIREVFDIRIRRPLKRILKNEGIAEFLNRKVKRYFHNK